MDSLEKKLYQLIIGRLNGEEIRTPAYRERIFELAGKGIGGFIIFGGEKDEVKPFLRELQSAAAIPLFIASDIERGVGQQIRGNTLFPCQMALSAAIDKSRPEDVDVLRSVIRAVAEEAEDAGINMPLIPVLDVNMDPDNPIICTRAFSDDPADVAWFGSEFIEILESSGLISCAKHFPGHGDTSSDSHMMLPVINKSLNDLIDADLFPFAAAIRSGVGSVMVGHLSIPALDQRPASLSRKIITDLLKGQLGFKGLVMTDALNMNALNEIGNVPAECLNAGADILLHPVDPEITVTELISSIKSGKVAEEQVDGAVDRILKTKARLKKTRKIDIDYQRHERLSSEITEMSISLLKNTPGFLPVVDKRELCVIFVGESEMYESSPFEGHFKKCLTLNEAAENFSAYGTLTTGEGTERRCSTALFAIFTKVSAWRGSSGISDSDKNRIRELMKKAGRAGAISFGSPYVLRHFKEADVLIAAYEPNEKAQEAVIKCLEGRLDFRGKIPVKIDWPL